MLIDMFSIDMPSVIMLKVVMRNVVAPFFFHVLFLKIYFIIRSVFETVFQ